MSILKRYTYTFVIHNTHFVSVVSLAPIRVVNGRENTLSLKARSGRPSLLSGSRLTLRSTCMLVRSCLYLSTPLFSSITGTVYPH